jgi:hypothetical protein
MQLAPMLRDAVAAELRAAASALTGGAMLLDPEATIVLATPDLSDEAADAARALARRSRSWGQDSTRTACDDGSWLYAILVGSWLLAVQSRTVTGAAEPLVVLRQARNSLASLLAGVIVPPNGGPPRGPGGAPAEATTASIRRGKA